jgi:hypothetical protein
MEWLIIFFNDLVWRVLKTRIFDGIRPKFIRSNAYKLIGKTRFSDSDFTTAVLGSKISVEYFSKFLYVDVPRVEFLGKCSLSKAASVGFAGVDLVIVEANVFFSRFLGDSGFFVAPRVDFVLELSGSVEEIQNRASEGKRRRLRQVAEAGYSFEVSKDLSKLESFYYDLYLPHMTKRHSGSALPISFAECKELFLRGELLLVKSGEDWVSANLLIPRDDELWEPVLAVRDVEKLTLGSYAIYRFSIVVGVERGFARMDFGEAPPFMQDGLFQFKKDLGMWVRSAKGSGAQVFGLRFSGVGGSVRGFLSVCPFVFLDGGVLSGVVFVEVVDDLSVRPFCVSGLGSLYVVSSGDVSGLRGFRFEKLCVEGLGGGVSVLGFLGRFCVEGKYSLYCLTLEKQVIS